MDRVWLVTGASSGFGRAISEAALAAGDVVVGAARRTEALEDLVAARPGRMEALRLDVTDTAAAETAVREVVARHGRIDVQVNNAGRTHVGAVEETTDQELRGLFDVHVLGPAALVRAVLPHLRERRSGAIVQMSSVGGQRSFAGFGGYSAAKFALEGLSEALADEVAEYGIRVLIVEPGAFRTSVFAASRAGASPDSGVYEKVTRSRAWVSGGDGTQPGDPAKAAALILAALDADDAPLRLPLGEDAVTGVLEHLDAIRGDIAAWEERTRATAIGD
ncbi:SDR family NAD(P)-dependent oxidoreductase [Streptomyces sp. NPDC046831]|uniref:SDR family NAD(P)-dependent oxidoreductase n=1 Tax=Streptomyces sp. NPDC046831 TaxID=3154805 RepID=UPI0033CD44E4